MAAPNPSPLYGLHMSSDLIMMGAHRRKQALMMSSDGLPSSHSCRTSLIQAVSRFLSQPKVPEDQAQVSFGNPCRRRAATARTVSQVAVLSAALHTRTCHSGPAPTGSYLTSAGECAPATLGVALHARGISKRNNPLGQHAAV